MPEQKTPAEIPARQDMTLANWREFPSSRYSFQHVPEFVPVAEIRPGGGPEDPSSGEERLRDAALADAAGGALDFDSYFTSSHGDHLVVMRDWQVLAEHKAPHCLPNRPHLIFSISKSVTGLMAGIAADDGLLDVDQRVGAYLELPNGSAFADARVRDLLDMTVDLDFDEEYLDDGGAFDRYRRAMLWNPERPDTTPETMAGFLGSLGRKGGTHGRVFAYASPVSDMLGLVVEKASGRRYHEFLADRLFGPLGMRGAAHVTVDREGTARAAGGICITTCDLAQLGQLVMAHGRGADGRQVVPEGWMDDMRANGNRQAWIDGNFSDLFANGRYRSCWYEVGDARGSFAAIGIHGQWIWGDRASGVVVAKTSSRPTPSDDDANALEIAVLSGIAKAFGEEP